MTVDCSKLDLPKRVIEDANVLSINPAFLLHCKLLATLCPVQPGNPRPEVFPHIRGFVTAGLFEANKRVSRGGLLGLDLRSRLVVPHEKDVFVLEIGLCHVYLVRIAGELQSEKRELH